MEYQQISSLGRSVCESVSKVVIGCEKQIELVVSALFAGGHVLLQDVPGTGKTTMAKSLARSLDCSFARVQFTPDLLPSDVLGTRVWLQQKGAFEFVKGPAFVQILLADEINRATPRTQAALLECMEEKQITEGGVTWPLEQPFFVIATQNPVESHGTFPLPQAQLDRFLIRIALGYPSAGQSVDMLKRLNRGDYMDAVTPVADAQRIVEATKLCRQCHVSDAVLQYLVAVCEAARDPDRVRLGPSPRAELMLMRMAQALAAIRGRDYVIPDDIKELAIPVLAHRIIMRGAMMLDAASFLTEVLDRVPVPTEDAL